MGSLPSPPTPSFLNHRPQGGIGGETQGYLWDNFSRQLGLLPHPKWRPGDVHCHCGGAGCLGSLRDSPEDPGLQVPLISDFPILTLQEGPGVSLGVNPGSATYCLCDFGMIYLTFLSLSFSL